MNRILIILLAAIGLNVGSKAETLPYESMLKDGNTWWYLCNVSDYTSEFPFLMDVIAKNNGISLIYYKISMTETPSITAWNTGRYMCRTTGATTLWSHLCSP